LSRVSKKLKNIFIIKTSWLLLVSIAMRFLDINQDFSYILLAIYAFFGNMCAIEALMLCFFFRHINNSFDINSTFSLSYLVVISSIISIFWHSKLYNLKKFFFLDSFFFFTVFFGFFLIIHGIFFSNYMLISVLKASVWLFLSISLLMGFSSLSTHEISKLQKRFFWFFSALVLINFFIYLVTDIGYEHDARYFQGIFNHSQVLGIVTSLFSSIVFIIILNQKNFSLKAIFFIAIFTSSLILIFLTSSRTALLSLFFSVIIFVFFSTFFKKKNFLVTYNIFLNKNFSTLGILLLLPLIFFYDYFYRILITFLQKNSNIENLIGSYISSRMIVIEPMIENIKTKWLTGIGFGIPSFDTYSPIKQITFETLIFFTYEKGNLYLLILEELGLLGILIFIFWLFLLIQRLILSGDNIALIFVINILLINIGEAVMFSTGGLGLLILILLFWAATRPNSLSKNSYEKF
jgi:hypothetical protein